MVPPRIDLVWILPTGSSSGKDATSPLSSNGRDRCEQRCTFSLAAPSVNVLEWTLWETLQHFERERLKIEDTNGDFASGVNAAAAREESGPAERNTVYNIPRLTGWVGVPPVEKTSLFELTITRPGWLQPVIKVMYPATAAGARVIGANTDGPESGGSAITIESDSNLKTTKLRSLIHQENGRVPLVLHLEHRYRAVPMSDVEKREIVAAFEKRWNQAMQATASSSSAASTGMKNAVGAGSPFVLQKGDTTGVQVVGAPREVLGEAQRGICIFLGAATVSSVHKPAAALLRTYETDADTSVSALSSAVDVSMTEEQAQSVAAKSVYDIRPGDSRRYAAKIRAMAQGKDVAGLDCSSKAAGAFSDTRIRLRFPQQLFVEARFRASEVVGDLRTFVTSILRQRGGGGGAVRCVGSVSGSGDTERGRRRSGHKFQLSISPPRRVLTDDSASLRALGLIPSAVVDVSWVSDGASASGSGVHYSPASVLREDLISNIIGSSALPMGGKATAVKSQ